MWEDQSLRTNDPGRSMFGNVGNVSLDMGRSLDDGNGSILACAISSSSFKNHVSWRSN